MDPQHLRFTLDPQNPSYLVIGDDVIIRESARLHRATKPGTQNATRIGNHCFLMGAIHVAHDCVLESHVTMADGALLGGHCTIGSQVFLGGGCTLHQFVRVGRLSIVGGNEAAGQGRACYLRPFDSAGSRDTTPLAVAEPSMPPARRVVAIRGGSTFAAAPAHRAYHLSARPAGMPIRAELPDGPEMREILEFIATSKRGVLHSRDRNKALPEGRFSPDVSACV